MSLNRTLDIENPDINYVISLDFGQTRNPNAENYLEQYANEIISSIKIMMNDDTIVVDLSDIDAHLTNFYEYISDDNYSSTATIIINEPSATDEDENE